MRAGGLDREIVIQQATETRDSYGEPVPAWATFATVPAQRRDMRGAERYAADHDVAVRAAVYRLYWIAGVTEQMRLVDGATFRITGIAEDRRQNWLELSVEAIDPGAVA
jgi:SPP1 family predicted phage head-tail adaptor